MLTHKLINIGAHAGLAQACQGLASPEGAGAAEVLLAAWQDCLEAVSCGTEAVSQSLQPGLMLAASASAAAALSSAVLLDSKPRAEHLAALLRGLVCSPAPGRVVGTAAQALGALQAALLASDAQQEIPAAVDCLREAASGAGRLPQAAAAKAGIAAGLAALCGASNTGQQGWLLNHDAGRKQTEAALEVSCRVYSQCAAT